MTIARRYSLQEMNPFKEAGARELMVRQTVELLANGELNDEAAARLLEVEERADLEEIVSRYRGESSSEISQEELMIYLGAEIEELNGEIRRLEDEADRKGVVAPVLGEVAVGSVA